MEVTLGAVQEATLPAAGPQGETNCVVTEDLAESTKGNTD